MGRYRRHAVYINDEVSDSAINAAIAERQILSELGPKACIMEEPCKVHATRKAKRGAQPDWGDILRYDLISILLYRNDPTAPQTFLMDSQRFLQQRR